MNRRQWLRAGSTAAAGLVLGGGSFACRPGASRSGDASPVSMPLLLKNNESPYGLSPRAAAALTEAASRSNRYPHKQYIELRELIAARENLDPEQVILGAGSTEIMCLILASYGGRGRALAADPTYFDFVYYADTWHCALEQVPLNQRFEHDTETLAGRVTGETSLIYICNPNNPTGSITPASALRAFCQKASDKALVVVDEAYHDYVDDPAYESMRDLVRQGRNVVVTRTFSKIYGMAGLRVGYALARPEVIEVLDGIRMNFASISWPSLKAAMAGYGDVDFTGGVREKNRRVRDHVLLELNRRGFPTVPSQTNFVLFRISQDAATAADLLDTRGVLLRPVVFGGRQWLRVSLGTQEEMEAFFDVLDRSGISGPG